MIPAPTPPPTIIRERVSPVCSALHQLVIPLAQMNIKNKALTDRIKINYAQLQKYMATRLGDGVFLKQAQNDQLATNLLQNISEVERDLVQSYHQYPQGTNVKVDALRQRVQNVVDIERSVANIYSQAYGSVVDNDGVTGIENSLTQLVGERADPHAAATPLPSDLALPTPIPIPNEDIAAKEAAAADNDPRLSSSVPPGFAMRSLKWSRLSELQRLLHREGPALEAQALVAAHDCDGI